MPDPFPLFPFPRLEPLPAGAHSSNRGEAPLPPQTALQPQSCQGDCITTAVEGRRPIFADFTLVRIVVNEMRRLHNEGVVQSLAFVVMAEYLYWLFVLGERQTLSMVMQRLKGCSAFRLGQVPGVPAPVWQRGFYEHGVRREEEIRDIARPWRRQSARRAER